jgi:hypothetical protein
MMIHSPVILFIRLSQSEMLSPTGCHTAALTGLQWQGIVQMPGRRESEKVKELGGGWEAISACAQHHIPLMSVLYLQ